jgi:signal peptidase I
MSRRLERTAARVASSRLLPLEERSRILEEVREHLEGTAAEYEALGYTRRRAERQALRDFGDVRKSRTDLGRAWRGRRTVLLPEAPGDHLLSFLIYDLKPILLILCLVLLLRWQVVAAYHIPTKSMEPTLHGDPADGDKILVNKLYFHLYEPKRWQVAVFERDGEDRNLIKRIVGLPGETMDILGGDILIDEAIARKPRGVQDELLVPVFARNRNLILELDGDSAVGLEAWDGTGEWNQAEERFACTAGEADVVRLAWPGRVRDEYPGGGKRYDSEEVGDLVLRFIVHPEQGATTVGVVLREGDDTFRARIPVGSTGDAVLLHAGEDHAGEEVARAEGCSLSAGREARVRFANLDGVVTLEVDDVEVLSYEPPEPSVAADIESPVAELGFRGGSAEFRAVELLRDIYYRTESSLPTEIPEDHYFMLGDNSGNSMDSRTWGSVPKAGLIGRPIFVIWPPSRLKLVH